MVEATLSDVYPSRIIRLHWLRRPARDRSDFRFAIDKEEVHACSRPNSEHECSHDYHPPSGHRQWVCGRVLQRPDAFIYTGGGSDPLARWLSVSGPFSMCISSQIPAGRRRMFCTLVGTSSLVQDCCHMEFLCTEYRIRNTGVLSLQSSRAPRVHRHKRQHPQRDLKI